MGSLPATITPSSGGQEKRSSDRVQLFREIVASVISIAIACITLWMLVDSYNTGRTPVSPMKPDDKQNTAEVQEKRDAYGRQKDLLLLALSLFGTVTGYYLGRVPAELRAQQAQQTADTANRQLSGANTAAVNAATAAVAATKDADAAKKQRDDAKTTLTSVRTRLGGVVNQHAILSEGGGESAVDQQAVAEALQEIDDFMRRADR